jgi:hypothetical protein
MARPVISSTATFLGVVLFLVGFLAEAGILRLSSRPCSSSSLMDDALSEALDSLVSSVLSDYLFSLYELLSSSKSSMSEWQ